MNALPKMAMGFRDSSCVTEILAMERSKALSGQRGSGYLRAFAHVCTDVQGLLSRNSFVSSCRKMSTLKYSSAILARSAGLTCSRKSRQLSWQVAPLLALLRSKTLQLYSLERLFLRSLLKRNGTQRPKVPFDGAMIRLPDGSRSMLSIRIHRSKRCALRSQRTTFIRACSPTRCSRPAPAAPPRAAARACARPDPRRP